MYMQKYFRVQEKDVKVSSQHGDKIESIPMFSCCIVRMTNVCSYHNIVK